MLAEGEEDVVEVAPAVRLRVVDPVQETVDACGRPHGFRRRCRKLAQTAVLPERKRQQRRSECQRKRNHRPPSEEKEPHGGWEEKDRSRGLAGGRVGGRQT